jgi:hypothetical protein
MGDDRMLPRRLRWVFFAASSVVLGASYAATSSEGVQVLALLALTFGVYPAATRALGERSEYAKVARDLSAPRRVMAVSLAFLLLWGALIYVAAPELELGPWFWWWVVFCPWMEVHVLLAEGQLLRSGGAGWKPARPLRDSLLAGPLTAAVIAVITSLQGARLGEALLTGLLCAGVVLALAGAFVWMSRRAATSPRPPRTSR